MGDANFQGSQTLRITVGNKVTICPSKERNKGGGYRQRGKEREREKK